jgi:hypothetical protein
MNETHTEVGAVTADAEFNRDAEHNRIQPPDELGAVIIPIFQSIPKAHCQISAMQKNKEEES